MIKRSINEIIIVLGDFDPRYMSSISDEEIGQMGHALREAQVVLKHQDEWISWLEGVIYGWANGDEDANVRLREIADDIENPDEDAEFILQNEASDGSIQRPKHSSLLKKWDENC